MRPRGWLFLVVAVLAVLGLGLAALAGWGSPNAPRGPFGTMLPAVTLTTVVVAGLLDGINPCAFTVLLLLISALLVAVQGSTPQGAIALRARVVGLGSIYIAAVFLTYLALGVGLLAAAGLFTQYHVPARVGAVLSITFGLWMLKDVFLPGMGPRLQAPVAVGRWAKEAARRMTVPALVVSGFLIGLCTVPCSGAVYLAVLSLLAAQPSALQGFAYLVLYNVMFILPLLGILVIASTRPLLNRLARWNLHHKEQVRLALGSGVVLMGLAILATV